MPNEPLNTFRAVEPANWGYGAASTLASQPFVLYHHRETLTGTGTPVTNFGFTFDALGTERFLPWVNRLDAKVFPVKVPNAYDRIHISAMFCTDASVGNPGTLVYGTAYSSPWVLPFGLAPQTRGAPFGGRNNPVGGTRFPEDLIKQLAPNATAAINSRTNGHWNVLPPYASNFSTNHGALAAGSSTNPTHFGRATVGTGPGYALPLDFSLATSTTAALTLTANAAVASSVIASQGQEFQTLGSEEIAVSIGAFPTPLTGTHPGVLNTVYGFNFFLIGMFLG